MTRTANKDAKTTQIVLIPKPEWQVEIRAFKELHARNGLSMSETIMERAVKTFLRDHHWPPGNSQTQIVSFAKAEMKGEEHKCFVCGKLATYDMVYLPTEKTYWACAKHRKQMLEDGKSQK